MDFDLIDPIGHDDEPRRPFRNHRLRRGVYVLPSALTVANLLCGYYAVLATLDGQMDNAARAIGFAIVFDSLDGRVARAMGTNSEFGKQFDSLADVISFGIAPAFLAYAWGVKLAAYAPGVSGAGYLIQLGWLIGFFFLCCCAWRLARFNIQGMAPGSNRFFVGMPTPAAAGMIAAVVHAFKSPLQEPGWAITWILLVLCLAGLMTSTIRFYSFKDIPWTRKQPSVAIVALAVLGAAIWRWSEVVLLFLATTYAVTGVTLHVVRYVRRRTATRSA